MLKIVAIVMQVALVTVIAYTLVTAVAGWRDPRPAPIGARRRRFLVVIPAHNEERVVGRIVEDLMASAYPRELVDVWVVADRCTDATEEVARAAGARVHARRDGTGGKASAIAELLTAVPLRDGTSLLVFDADNRVPPELIGRFSDELDVGHTTIQAYIDSTDPERNWLALASALSYWASNRMVQLSRHNLDWPVDLGGTGMCLSSEALLAAGGLAESLVEDQDLTARLALADVRVHWIHDMRVRDEKPSSARVAVRQRARWAAGRRMSARRHFIPLVRAAWVRRRWAEADLALRLVQPSRIAMAGLSGLLAIAAFFTELLWPPLLWGTVALIQFLSPVAFLVREGVPGRWILRYPVLALLAVLWFPVQIMSRRVAGWYHTPHGG